MGEKKDSEAGIIFLIMMIIGLILAVIGLTFYVIELKKENAKLEDEATSNTNNEVVTSVVDEDDDEEVIVEEIEKEGTEILSNDEALSLIETYYTLAESIYYLKNEELDIDNMEILNYEEVIGKYFSNSFSKAFKPMLTYEENGRYLIELGGMPEYYSNLSFKNIEINEDEISCIVVFDLTVGEELIEEDVRNSFSIVKENDEWKIDDYKPAS